MAEIKNRAERRQSATKKVDHIKSRILVAVKEEAEAPELKELTPRKGLKRVLAAACAEGETLFKETSPQDRHLVRRAVIEVKSDIAELVAAMRLEADHA